MKEKAIVAVQKGNLDKMQSYLLDEGIAFRVIAGEVPCLFFPRIEKKTAASFMEQFSIPYAMLPNGLLVNGKVRLLDFSDMPMKSTPSIWASLFVRESLETIKEELKQA